MFFGPVRYNLSTGNHETPSFLPPPSTYPKKLSIQKFFQNRKGSFTNILGTNQFVSNIRNGSFTILLRTVRWNNFDRKSWYCISYLYHFSIPGVFWKTEEFLYEDIRSCETKSFWLEVVITHPISISITFFDLRFFLKHRNFLKHGRVSSWIYSVMWDKRISQETHDTLCLISNNFRYNQEHRKVPYEVFLSCDTLIFRREIAILLFFPPRPLISQNFVDTNFFPQSRTVCLQNYSVLWDETILTENRDTPSLFSNISRYQKFSAKKKKSPTNNFGPTRQQPFDGKSRNSIFPTSLLHISKEFVDTKVFPKPWRVRFVLGTVRQNKFDGKSCYPLFYL